MPALAEISVNLIIVTAVEHPRSVRRFRKTVGREDLPNRLQDIVRNGAGEAHHAQPIGRIEQIVAARPLPLCHQPVNVGATAAEHIAAQSFQGLVDRAPAIAAGFRQGFLPYPDDIDSPRKFSLGDLGFDRVAAIS